MTVQRVSRSRPEPAPVRRFGLLAFLAVLLVYGATAGGSMGTKDAAGMFQITARIVHDGEVSQPPGWDGMQEARGTDGHFYSPFGIGQSLYNIPFYAAGRLAERVIGGRIGRSDAIAKAFVVLGNAVAAAAVVGLALVFALRVSGDARAACAAAFALAFGTQLWPYSRFGFNAPVTTLCLLAGVYFSWLGIRHPNRRSFLWSGAALGAAMLTRHELALAFLPVAAWTLWEGGRGTRRGLSEYWPGLVAGGTAVVIWLAYNFVRFGNPIYSGYRPSFGAAGFAGLLVSPQSSLFLYSPIAVLGVVALVRLATEDRSTAVLFTGVIAVLFLFYASLADWRGVRSYGPRYLVPLLPFFCIPLAVLIARTRQSAARFAVAALVVLSVLVQMPAVLTDPARTRLLAAETSPTEEAEDTTWSSSARGAVAMTAGNLRILTGAEARPPATRTPGGSFSEQLGFSLDFWWLYLYYLGVIPLGLALGLAAAMLLAAAILFRHVWTLAAETDAVAASMGART